MNISVPESDSETYKNYIWNESAILILLLYTFCSKCNENKLRITYKSDGICTKAILSCSQCQFSRKIDMDYKSEKSISQEINVRAVSGCLYGGGTFTILKSIFSYMNIPCFRTKCFTSIAKDIAERSDEVSAILI